MSFDPWKKVIENEKQSDLRLGDTLTIGLQIDEDEVHISEKDKENAVDLRKEQPDRDAVSYLPEDVARSLCMLPLRINNGRLEIATSNPDPQLKNLLSLRLRKPIPIEFRYAPKSEITKVIDNVYSRQISIEDKDRTAVRDETWAVRMVDTILQGGLKARASDIHLDPQERDAVIRYRVDGVLHDVGTIPASDYGSVVSRIKVLANLSVVEHLLPQDGQMMFESERGRVDVRVSIMPSVNGENIVMRLLDRSQINFDLENLGFEEHTLKSYRGIVGQPHGMILVIGPTGSGKTTTLYSTIAEVDREAKNVMALEDPVEYRFPRVVQVQVNPKSGLTFAAGLRAFLRQDPDVIIVGEVRDAETANIAIQSALTGHLVLSSIHAMDCVSGLLRLIDMGIEPYFVAAAVTGAISQRLVRRICPHCKETTELTAAEQEYLKKWSITFDKLPVRGAGCSSCAFTGYYGRVGIYEVLPVTSEIQGMLARSDSRDALYQAALNAKMIPLPLAALQKVQQGETTVSEVMRVVHG